MNRGYPLQQSPALPPPPGAGPPPRAASCPSHSGRTTPPRCGGRAWPEVSRKVPRPVGSLFGLSPTPSRPQPLGPRFPLVPESAWIRKPPLCRTDASDYRENRVRGGAQGKEGKRDTGCWQHGQDNKAIGAAEVGWWCGNMWRPTSITFRVDSTVDDTACFP